MARDAGVPISINTDAHRRESFESIRYGLATARRAWLEPKHVLNTWSVEDIRAFRAPA
jgi:DNA polymerase (family 10)